MQLNYSCPITGDQKDNTTIRVVAGLVLTITTITILIGMQVSSILAASIFGLLALDFVIRGFLMTKYSPLAALAKGLVFSLKLKQQLVDSGPKIFAARIGVLFTISGTVLYLLGNITAASIVAGILLICAGLEALFNFCLGCWMYSLLPGNIGRIFTYRFIR